jgi:hypothetical protein
MNVKVIDGCDRSSPCTHGRRRGLATGRDSRLTAMPTAAASVVISSPNPGVCRRGTTRSWPAYTVGQACGGAWKALTSSSLSTRLPGSTTLRPSSAQTRRALAAVPVIRRSCQHQLGRCYESRFCVAAEEEKTGEAEPTRPTVICRIRRGRCARGETVRESRDVRRAAHNPATRRRRVYRPVWAARRPDFTAWTRAS